MPLWPASGFRPAPSSTGVARAAARTVTWLRFLMTIRCRAYVPPASTTVPPERPRRSTASCGVRSGERTVPEAESDPCGDTYRVVAWCACASVPERPRTTAAVLTINAVRRTSDMPRTIAHRSHQRKRSIRTARSQRRADLVQVPERLPVGLDQPGLLVRHTDLLAVLLHDRLRLAQTRRRHPGEQVVLDLV